MNKFIMAIKSLVASNENLAIFIPKKMELFFYDEIFV